MDINRLNGGYKSYQWINVFIMGCLPPFSIGGFGKSIHRFQLDL